MTDKPAMSIDKTEAAAALAAAGQSEQRSFSLYAYRFNAPMLILWGAIWLLTDLAIAYGPNWAGRWGWTIAGITGGIICIAYYWRYSRHWQTTSPSRMSMGSFWRMLATWFFSGSFVACLMIIFSPGWREAHAFWGVFMAMLYACYGVWMGWRLMLLGVALGAATLYAFFSLDGQPYLLFMGIVCGGGMIAGGFWLRRA